ncbi:thiol:disulfide interchange protein [Actinoplanes sp. SE50]|uniref:redoxin domain-containing protein n=1 Tax=unclassified Actinoplanes TaxID=2626549 RepID=UPI00023EE04D|nr:MULTISPECIES: redoxin domain-containing protein [unclassified Actinoplanes]AEV88979.1 Thiol:disulfide interchange protein dsbE [Actinoplanes sp. SE50/110]ATO87385.1 thiol:disulfide interchange protein [Actinoplanes sp. SE50]SLM04803.1 thiol:disulfide interchange protein [Actinoplanes sp. SE50/110]
MRLLAPVAIAALLLSGCTAAAVKESQAPSPFAACAPATGGSTLPDITLDCLTGDSPVRLADLRGPAVLNIWGSYCGPCRAELPVIQKLADTGKLTVLGVDTGDTRAAAISFGTDHGVSMPTLFDPDRKLVAQLGVISLPSTIFVDATGKIFIYRYAMDAPALTEQVAKHAGVTVTL